MSRSPDFILKALNKVTESRSGKIGAAWRNDNGSLSIVLDVALLPDPNVVYTLFPNDATEHYARQNLAAVFPPPAAPAPRRGRKKKTITMADAPVSARHSIGG